jgi:hypothetical protein
MNVRVMQQILSPGVQHSEEADLRTEMLRVGGDDAQRLRRRPEQVIVDHSLVLKCDGGDQILHGEHHVEIGHMEQLGLTVLQPLRRPRPWHLGQLRLRHEL